MVFKYLGIEPPECVSVPWNKGEIPMAYRRKVKCLVCSVTYLPLIETKVVSCENCVKEHFRGALLETAEVLKDYDTINGELFEEKYPMLCDDEHTSTELLTKLLRVSAGENE